MEVTLTILLPILIGLTYFVAQQVRGIRTDLAKYMERLEEMNSAK